MAPSSIFEEIATGLPLAIGLGVVVAISAGFLTRLRFSVQIEMNGVVTWPRALVLGPQRVARAPTTAAADPR
jgi:hypothetical protein